MLKLAICTLILSGSLLISQNAHSQEISPKIEIVQLPNVGDIVESQIGNSLVSSYNKEYYKGVRLEEKVTASLLGLTWTIISPVDLYFNYEDDKWIYYQCVDECILLEDNMSKKRKFSAKGGIKISKKNGKYSLFQRIDDIRSLGPKLEQVPVLTEKEITLESSKGLKLEFIYSGIQNDLVKFIYREFIDDFARPSFTQEVQYDLKKDKIVGFKMK